MIRLGILLMAAGAIVVALPDSGERLFSLSETHGPSLVDAVGIVLLLTGWALLLRAIWRRRVRPAGRWTHAVTGAVFSIGTVILVVAIVTDAGWWWLLGAALMGSAQAFMLGVAVRA